MRFVRLLWLSAFVVAAAQHPEGVPAADGLRSYIAPAASDSASALPGTYSFEVEVAPNGDVVAIRTNPCDPPVPDELGNVARGWKFIPFAGPSSQFRRVTFVFKPGWTMDETRVETWYESPLTLHVERIESIVQRCPRIDGKAPEKACPVHHEPMHLTVLPIHYSGPPVSDPTPLMTEYIRAFLDQFPNAGDHVEMGDVVTQYQFAEVFLCASCMKARRAWLSAHQEFTPP